MNLKMNDNSSINGTCIRPKDQFFNKDFYSSVTVILYILYLTIAILAIFGNTLVIAAVARFHVLKTPTYFFIASLAVNDLLLGVVVLVDTFLVLIIPCATLYATCIGMNILENIVIMVAVLNLTGIAYDRYLSIVSPLHYAQTMTNTRAAYCIAFAWIYGTLIGLLPLIPGMRIKRQEFSECLIYAVFPPGYIYFMIYGHFYLFFLVICCFYSRIFVIARRHSLQIQNLEPAQLQPSTLNPSTKRKRPSALRLNLGTVKTMGIVIGSMFLLWSPLFVLLTYVNACKKMCHVNFSVYVLAFILFYMNSCMNFFIYAWRNQEIRRAFKRLLCCKGTGSDNLNVTLHLTEQASSGRRSDQSIPYQLRIRESDQSMPDKSRSKSDQSTSEQMSNLRSDQSTSVKEAMKPFKNDTGLNSGERICKSSKSGLEERNVLETEAPPGGESQNYQTKCKMEHARENSELQQQAMCKRECKKSQNKQKSISFCNEIFFINERTVSFKRSATAGDISVSSLCDSCEHLQSKDCNMLKSHSNDLHTLNDKDSCVINQETTKHLHKSKTLSLLHTKKWVLCEKLSIPGDATESTHCETDSSSCSREYICEAKSYQSRTDKSNPNETGLLQIISGQVSKGQVTKGHVSKGQVTKGHVSKGQVTKGQFSKGTDNLGFVEDAGEKSDSMSRK